MPAPIVEQCDQMAILFFQYLPIYNNANLPKKIFLKNVQNVAKLTLKIAKVFLKFHLSGEISPNLISLYYLVSNYVAQNLFT